MVFYGETGAGSHALEVFEKPDYSFNEAFSVEQARLARGPKLTYPMGKGDGGVLLTALRVGLERGFSCAIGISYQYQRVPDYHICLTRCGAEGKEDSGTSNGQ